MGAILAIGNLADSATITTTTGTMLLPLSQLQVAWARGLARGPSNYTAGSTELTIRVDLGSAKQWSAIGLVGLNDAVATGSLKFSSTGAGNQEVGTGTLENDGLNGDTHGNSLWYVNSALVTCRYIEIYVQVFALPAGLRYVDIRRLFIATANGTAATTTVFSEGVDFDWSLTHVDLSSAEETPRGGVFTSPQGTFRRLQFGVSGMTAQEATDLRTWIAAARRTTECVVTLREEDTDILQSNRTIYGRLVDWSPIVHTGGDTYACDSITVHETTYPAL